MTVAHPLDINNAMAFQIWLARRFQPTTMYGACWAYCVLCLLITLAVSGRRLFGGHSGCYVAVGGRTGSKAEPSEKQQAAKPVSFQRTLLTMYLASFALGPILDNFHGQFGTLAYEAVSLPFRLQVGGLVLLQSAAWVPFMFGGAGVVMPTLLKALDGAFDTAPQRLNPGWWKTFLTIAIFSGQYWLSGLLDSTLTPLPVIHCVLAVLAISGWAALDGSAAGAVLGLCTAAAGVVTEVGLTSLGLYHYTHADFLGVCSWIPWVYFLGAPAVGNLARAVERQSEK
eukprot:EG_transcript_19993